MGENQLCFGCMEYKSESERVCPHCGYTSGSPYNPNYMIPGTVLGDRYAVGVMIGSNSEGATYVGYDRSIGCKVLLREYMPKGLCVRVRGKATISVNPNQLVQYKALMAEFTDLHKLLAQMRNHPHINATLDLFSLNNTTYAVYEYLEGIKLVDYLKDNAGELSWNTVARMFPPFFTSLSLMHNTGLIHRAISPDTIYVTQNGELRLCGFSISSVRTVHTELPPEMFHGYAAPEQYSPSARQGTWTDVYGICAVLYRILTGCKPTEAPSRMEKDNLCPPHEMNTSIPVHVSHTIMRGLTLFGQDRIQTITELVTQLFDVPIEPAVTMASTSHSHKGQGRRGGDDYDDYGNFGTDEDYDDYEDDVNRDTVIDRIKIPIIIGVLLTCVLFVIAIVVLSLLDLGPFSEDTSSTSSVDSIIEMETETETETIDNIVTETEPSTETNGDSIMPNLVGKEYVTKKESLEADGWIYLEASYEYSDDYGTGIIMEQSIVAGSSFQSGSTVTVVVSKGSSHVTIPDYSGMTLSQYESALDELGLTEFYTTEAVTNYSYSNGYVIELSVDAGTEFDLTAEDTIKIYYASNPETTTTTSTTTVQTTTTTEETVSTTESTTIVDSTTVAAETTIETTTTTVQEALENTEEE